MVRLRGNQGKLRAAAVGKRTGTGKGRLHREEARLRIHELRQLRDRTTVAGAVLLYGYDLAHRQVLKDILGYVKLDDLRAGTGDDAELRGLGHHTVQGHVLVLYDAGRRCGHRSKLHLSLVVQLRTRRLGLRSIHLGSCGLRGVRGLVIALH